jgi:hypothetical protein
MRDYRFILAFGLLLAFSVGIAVVAAHLPIHVATADFRHWVPLLR